MVVVYTFGNLYSDFDAESSGENDRTQDKAPNHRPGLLFANATYATRKGPCDAHLYSATADHCTLSGGSNLMRTTLVTSPRLQNCAGFYSFDQTLVSASSRVALIVKLP